MNHEVCYVLLMLFSRRTVATKSLFWTLLTGEEASLSRCICRRNPAATVFSSNLLVTACTRTSTALTFTLVDLFGNLTSITYKVNSFCHRDPILKKSVTSIIYFFLLVRYTVPLNMTENKSSEIFIFLRNKVLGSRSGFWSI